MVTEKQRITSEILMNRLDNIDYSEHRRLKKGIWSEEFDEIFKRGKYKE